LSSHIGSGAQVAYSAGAGGISLEIKRPGREADTLIECRC
jgi:hypothetical protein